MQKAKLILILLLVIVGIAVTLLVFVQRNKNIRTKQEIQAEQIIRSFIDAKGMSIQPDTEEYTIFMRRIVWNEYSELTGHASDFIKNQDELDYVLDYAWKYSGYKDLYGDYNEPNVEEAKPSSTEPSQ